MTRVYLLVAFTSLLMHAALVDIHWTPNESIFEMQHQFEHGAKEPLLKFDESSDLIAASPDGKLVLVVRSHYAYDVGDDRFMEMNVPPRQGKGYSTQVVNLFTLNESVKVGGSWSKMTLPRDARVHFIRFVDGICELRVLRTSDGRVLDFRGAPSLLYRMSNLTAKIHGHRDGELWNILEKYAEPVAGPNNR